MNVKDYIREQIIIKNIYYNINRMNNIKNI